MPSCAADADSPSPHCCPFLQGAGCGTVLLYAGAIAEDPTIENIFEEKIAAHSVQEAKKAVNIKAASVAEPKLRGMRGFAAMFA